MAELYASGDYSDVSFFVEDTVVKCHKVILSSRCEYFARMFLSGLMESSASEVPVYDSTFEAFDAVIKVRKRPKTTSNFQGFVRSRRCAAERQTCRRAIPCRRFKSKRFRNEFF